MVQESQPAAALVVEEKAAPDSFPPCLPGATPARLDSPPSSVVADAASYSPRLAGLEEGEEVLGREGKGWGMRDGDEG